MKRFLLSTLVVSTLVGIPVISHAMSKVSDIAGVSTSPTLEIGLVTAPTSDMDAGVVDTVANGVSTSPTVNIDQDPVGFANQVFEAGKSKEYRLLVILVIFGIVWAARKWGKKLVPWFDSDRGGAVLALSVGILERLATMAASGGTLTVWLIFEGVINAASAAGGLTIIKRIVEPKDVK